MLYDRATGAPHRQLGCFGPGQVGVMVAAPGAFVVLVDDELVGYA
jgi:hypothetical protein